VPAADPVTGIGFLFVLVFVFLSTSRVLDFKLQGLHLPLILSLIGALFVCLGSGVITAFQTRTAKFMGFFALWLVICVPFSEWRGGSFSLLAETFSKSFALFVMVAGVTTSLVRVKRLMLAIACGAVVAMGLALAINFKVAGRLSLPAGALANPNDLAQVLLVGLCLLPWTANSASPLVRVAMVPLALALLYAILATGSRAALLAILLIAAAIFWHAAPLKRVVLIAAFAAGGIALVAFSPQAARDRFHTIFSDGAEEELTAEDVMAIGSRKSRIELFKDSLILTLKKPVFGVGPGNFMSSAARRSEEAGKRAFWKESHNSYTQVSSESGLPGLFFFGGALWLALRGLAQARKRSQNDPRLAPVHDLATRLFFALLVFAFTSAFSSVAYQFFFSLLLGLAAAASHVFHAEIPPAPTPEPLIPRRAPPPKPPRSNARTRS
jgi:O-antigen ligase